MPDNTPDPSRKLAEADRLIAGAEAHIARQSDLVARLDIGGHDTAAAEGFLRRMEAALDAMHEHRRRIERELPGARSPGA